MMRKAIVIAALAATVCLSGGCDFFRVLAGRPTSQEIVAKRVRIGRELAANRRQEPDSAAEEQSRQEPDTLALPDTLPEVMPQTPLPQETIPTRKLPGIGPGVLAHRYYLMIGAFGQSGNAARQAERAEKAGYPAVLVSLRSGMTAVAVCPTDDLNAAWKMLDKLRQEPFCPADAWILDNE